MAPVRMTIVPASNLVCRDEQAKDQEERQKTRQKKSCQEGTEVVAEASFSALRRKKRIRKWYNHGERIPYTLDMGSEWTDLEDASEQLGFFFGELRAGIGW